MVLLFKMAPKHSAQALPSDGGRLCCARQGNTCVSGKSCSHVRNGAAGCDVNVSESVAYANK